MVRFQSVEFEKFRKNEFRVTDVKTESLLSSTNIISYASIIYNKMLSFAAQSIKYHTYHIKHNIPKLFIKKWGSKGYPVQILIGLQGFIPLCLRKTFFIRQLRIEQ